MGIRLLRMDRLSLKWKFIRDGLTGGCHKWMFARDGDRHFFMDWCSPTANGHSFGMRRCSSLKVWYGFVAGDYSSALN